MKKILICLTSYFILYSSSIVCKAQAPYHDAAFQPIEFTAPKSKRTWQKQRRNIEQTAWMLLGERPASPNIAQNIQIISKEDREFYTLETFRFFNGVDANVRGILLLPKNVHGKIPAVLYNHYHGGEYAHGKDEVFKKNWVNEEGVGESLVKNGYAVMAIDAYAFGERSGEGVNGSSEKGKDEELSWTKINLWKGRTFWGMIVRDDQLALDYLTSRSEIDASRIATMGMSMGGFRSWWLGALDSRIKVTVAAASIVRNQAILTDGSVKSHGIYYYLPNFLQYFDTESVIALIAPRPFLALSGTQDRLAPLNGVQYITQSLKKIYTLYGKNETFKHIEYEGVKHELTPQMWQEIIRFLNETL